jgi:hypothetical protein
MARNFQNPAIPPGPEASLTADEKPANLKMAERPTATAPTARGSATRSMLRDAARQR